MIEMRSKITRSVLNYFFLNPGEKLYVNEMARALDLDKRNLVKKLKYLEDEGILLSESRGNQKVYSVNDRYPLYEEYRQIVFKTIGVENKVREIFKKTSGVEKAYIFGSYVGGKMEAHSDIDLLVVGNHKILDLQREIGRLQKEIGRVINVVNMDGKEFAKRQKEKDPFIGTVLKEKHIEVA